MTKSLGLDWIGRERKWRKREKTIWKSVEHVGWKSILFFFSFKSWSVKYRSGTNRTRQKVFLKKYLKFWSVEKWFHSIEKLIRLIEYQSNQAETKLKNWRDFRLVEKHIRFIKILEIWIFWKTTEVLCRKHSIQRISWMKCMRMSLKVFQKHFFSN